MVVVWFVMGLQWLLKTVVVVPVVMVLVFFFFFFGGRLWLLQW